VKVRLWGTRGSLAAPGPETARYGGNTSCVEVRGRGGTVVILDAGTGIRALGGSLASARRVHLLLSHLHMDHIQGLGFFAPLFRAGVEVHLWGPATTALDLRKRLVRYLSPPLFPVHLRELETLVLHDLPAGEFAVGEFRVAAELVCHPGSTVGYRIAAPEGVVTYLPDHEPALGVPNFPLVPEWTSGWSLARGADLLIHDAQYTREEYAIRIGWGHSTVEDALTFAALAGVKRLVTFHHDPEHDDDEVECLTLAATRAATPGFPVVAGAEGDVYEVG
jgi:phosphoribosyl 1,2-cyclic phosphodiesterase